jgi:DNA primase
MLYYGEDFLAAHKRLGGQFADNNKSELPEPAANNAADEEQLRVAELVALARAMEHWQRLMKEQPQGQAYCQQHKISFEAIKALGLGYSDGKLAEKLSPADRAALMRLGVITITGREAFAGCVIFPLIDGASGQVVSVCGRHTKRREHRLLPGERTGIFNPWAASGSDEVILVEGAKDAAALWSVGLPNAIALLGINGRLDEIIRHLRDNRVSRVVLMLDSDIAGEQATPRITKALSEHGINARVVKVPAKDPAEFIANGGTLEQLRSLINPLPLSTPAPARESSTTMSELDNGEIMFSFYGREYYVRGLSASGLDRLKVNIRIKFDGRLHLDTIDLYQANAREKFAQKVAQMMGEKESQIESNLLEMAEQLEKLRLQMRAKNKESANTPAAMTPAEQKAAYDYLRSDDLMKRIVADFRAGGLIGEPASVSVAYLATISRKLMNKKARPLSVLIIARSGAGKSSLQDAICAFVPPEDLVRVTRLTGQALFYKDPYSLQRKVLAIAEVEGAQAAFYSLRTLISDQHLSIAATRTDPQTGKLHTEHYELYGPVPVITTTTAADAFDEETRNRFVQLTMDESREQTRAILAEQRHSYTLAGVRGENKAEKLQRLHQNIQRLLKPMKVINPYVERLNYPANRLISRREQEKYLSLIATIALLHQHQREIKVDEDGLEYVEVLPADIALANELAQAVLWRSFDELAPPVRGMLQAIIAEFKARAASAGANIYELALSRREIRKSTGWSEWQVKNYCEKLVEMEYLQLIANGNGKAALYKLIAPIEEDEPKLEGLSDSEKLKSD